MLKKCFYNVIYNIMSGKICNKCKEVKTEYYASCKTICKDCKRSKMREVMAEKRRDQRDVEMELLKEIKVLQKEIRRLKRLNKAK